MPACETDFSSSADTASSSAGTSREELEDRDVAAEAAEDRREFDTDRATAEIAIVLGHLAEADRFVARDDAAFDRW